MVSLEGTDERNRETRDQGSKVKRVKLFKGETLAFSCRLVKGHWATEQQF
jgi:hypothetical protein